MLNVFITLAVFLPGCSPSDDPTSANTVPSAVLDSWRQSWSESANKIVKSAGDALNQNALSDADPESRAAALSNFDSALGTYLSWERMGEDIVSQSLLQICGADLLNEIAPYFSDGDLASRMPEELGKRYENCWIDVDLHVSTAPAYATMEFGKNHLPQILARHGIESNGQ